MRSRVKARLKFMVDDIGAEGMREPGRGQARRRSRTVELPFAIDVQPQVTSAFTPEARWGLSTSAFP